MLKVTGKQTTTRTHYLSDSNTFKFKGRSEEAKKALEIPKGVAIQNFEVVEQVLLIKDGKQSKLQSKLFAVALCGSVKSNSPAYMIEVEEGTEKKKEKEKEKELSTTDTDLEAGKE